VAPEGLGRGERDGETTSLAVREILPGRRQRALHVGRAWRSGEPVGHVGQGDQPAPPPEDATEPVANAAGHPSEAGAQKLATAVGHDGAVPQERTGGTGQHGRRGQRSPPSTTVSVGELAPVPEAPGPTGRGW
jgi:hypothetical protein